MTAADPAQVLDLPLPEGNDAGADTIREYLLSLLRNVWRGGEGFSGKRPFGNNGWKYDLYAVLIQAGFVDGELDEWGGVEHVDIAAADALIVRAIGAMS